MHTVQLLDDGSADLGVSGEGGVEAPIEPDQRHIDRDTVLLLDLDTLRPPHGHAGTTDMVGRVRTTTPPRGTGLCSRVPLGHSAASEAAHPPHALDPRRRKRWAIPFLSPGLTDLCQLIIGRWH